MKKTPKDGDSNDNYQDHRGEIVLSFQPLKIVAC